MPNQNLDHLIVRYVNGQLWLLNNKKSSDKIYLDSIKEIEKIEQAIKENQRSDKFLEKLKNHAKSFKKLGLKKISTPQITYIMKR